VLTRLTRVPQEMSWADVRRLVLDHKVGALNRDHTTKQRMFCVQTRFGVLDMHAPSVLILWQFALPIHYSKAGAFLCRT
jgi:hypothetical protein